MQIQKEKNERIETAIRVLIAFSVSIALLIIVIQLCGHNAISALASMFQGAFGSKFNFGSLIEYYILILICGSAYSLTRRIGYFNLGLEGSLYIGAMFSCAPGFLLPELPKYIIMPICLLSGMLAAALYGSICGSLKAFLNVNEACTTILMNYVAQFFCDYLLNNQWSAHSASPETPHVQENAMFTKLPLAPSRASYAIFVAIGVFAFVCFLTFKTTFGYKIRNVATNPRYCDAVGIKSKYVVLVTVILSCSLGGLAGGCEVLGKYGNFLQNFSQDSAFQGIIACLLVKNNLAFLPLSAFFIAFTKVGGNGMEYYTGIPSALITTVVPLLILLVSMDKMFDYKKLWSFLSGKQDVLRKENNV